MEVIERGTWKVWNEIKYNDYQQVQQYGQQAWVNKLCTEIFIFQQSKHKTMITYYFIIMRTKRSQLVTSKTVWSKRSVNANIIEIYETISDTSSKSKKTIVEKTMAKIMYNTIYYHSRDRGECPDPSPPPPTLDHCVMFLNCDIDFTLMHASVWLLNYHTCQILECCTFLLCWKLGESQLWRPSGLWLLLMTKHKQIYPHRR
jgi:hypothetical protein